MTLKKILSVMTAVMLSLVGLSSISISANATGIEYPCFISGVLGEAHENQAWHIGELQAGCEVVVIDGDGTYDVNWRIDVGPTNKTEFLMLVIPNLSSANYTDIGVIGYPNLEITINEFRVDGVPYDYAQSEKAAVLDYINGTAEARVYFVDKWAGSGVQDIPVELHVEESVGVTFTITGFGVQGSGGGSTDSDTPAATTTAATTTTTAVTTTTTFAQSVKEDATTTTVAEKTESTADDTADSSTADSSEDDGGPKTWMILVGVGIAAVIAAVVIVIIKIRNKRYYL